MRLEEGCQLQSGKYRIIRVLGQGGFGITYLAEHTILDKCVAIKEFFPKEYCDRDANRSLTIGSENNNDTVEKLKARFIKEAKNIAKLDHPGIIKIHDIFEENDTAYYVMDYIEGDNLNEIVKRDGPLPESKAIEYIVKVGEALEYIHSRNMTHFDVKPANILVNAKDDEPILIDFGLSKQYAKDGSSTSTMMHGVSQGYSPLELYTLGSITTFSPEIDIYSLGATLYYLLIGTVPPNVPELIDKSLTFPPTISATTQEVVKKAMSISRQKRYGSISNFIKSFIIVELQNDSNLELSNECKKDNGNLNIINNEDTIIINNRSHDLESKDSSIGKKKRVKKLKIIWGWGFIVILIIFTSIILFFCYQKNTSVSINLDRNITKIVSSVDKRPLINIREDAILNLNNLPANAFGAHQYKDYLLKLLNDSNLEINESELKNFHNIKSYIYRGDNSGSMRPALEYSGDLSVKVYDKEGNLFLNINNNINKQGISGNLYKNKNNTLIFLGARNYNEAENIYGDNYSYIYGVLYKAEENKIILLFKERGDNGNIKFHLYEILK